MEFHRKGDKYFCSCPKHSDSDPSLCISPDKNLFYCFSCHRGGNIINWLMSYEGLSFNESVDKVCKLTGEEIKNVKICEALKYYKQLERLAEQKIKKPIIREILPDSYLNNFTYEIPQEWIDEGITQESMERYGICIDNKSNRICYPIYDNEDRLIGVKGRTRFKDYKLLNIKKYMNYNHIITTDFFVGMKQNREIIKSTGSVYIFEGIKSGLKLCSWDLTNNWLAAETSKLNEEQVRVLLNLHIPEVTIAFDRDVDIREIKKCTAMLKRFCNVYAVRDRYNKNRLLPGDKDSPVDAGKEVWKQLVKERIRL